jgi:hypothetical protein
MLGSSVLKMLAIVCISETDGVENSDSNNFEATA